MVSRFAGRLGSWQSSCVLSRGGMPSDMRWEELRWSLRVRSGARRLSREHDRQAKAEAEIAARAVAIRGVGFVGSLLAAVVALWVTREVWGPGLPAGEDVMGHLVRADFGIDYLLSRGQIDGWFPRFMLGYQMYLFNGPGFNWTLGLVKALSLGTLSTDGAFKVVALGSLALTPSAVAFAARSLGLSRLAAGVAAVLSLAASTPFGMGLQGLFGTGLIPHQLGAIFFFLAFGSCLRLLRDPRARWVLLASVSIALLLVTHLISVMILAFLLLFYVGVDIATRETSRKGLIALMAAAGGSAALAAFWLVPFVAHRNLTAALTTWGVPPFGQRMAEILRGELLFTPFMAKLVAISLVALLVIPFLPLRRRLVLVAIPIAYLLLAHFLVRFPSTHQVSLQLPNRGLGYAGILALFPLAAVIGWAARMLPRGGSVIALGAAVTSVVVALGPLRNVPSQFPQPRAELRAASQVLARVVPDGARFAAERDFPSEIARTGVIHPETWLTRNSARNSLNVSIAEMSSTTAPFEIDYLGDKPMDESADALARYGVTHVVATSSRTAGSLEDSPRFARLWKDDPIAIFALKPGTGQPDPSSLLSSEGSPLSASLTKDDPEDLRISLDAQEDSRVYIALAWSPKWRGELDGSPLPLQRSHDSILTAAIPRGRHVVALQFESDVWDGIGRAISVASILVATLLVIASARKRSV